MPILGSRVPDRNQVRISLVSAIFFLEWSRSFGNFSTTKTPAYVDPGKPTPNPLKSTALYLLLTVKNAIVMNATIHCVRFTADGKLSEYVDRKLQKLNTFHDRIIKVDVYLKLDNVVHAIKDKIAEIRVQVPRHEFFVKASSKSFEESFDDALDAIINQIKRKKEKEAA